MKHGWLSEVKEYKKRIIIRKIFVFKYLPQPIDFYGCIITLPLLLNRFFVDLDFGNISDISDIIHLVMADEPTDCLRTKKKYNIHEEKKKTKDETNTS